MQAKHLVAIIVASTFLSVAVQRIIPSQTQQSTQTVVHESAYDRVMKTGALRCGYVLYPKFVERDVNSGKFSGAYVDLMEEIGKQLSLKIEWAEEVGMAAMLEGLKNGRYDVLCDPLTQTAGRARETEFTASVFFAPYYAYVRADDTRFDNDYSKINDPSVKYAYLEGELSQYLRVELFPKTQALSMPDLTDVSQVLLQVSLGKADIMTTEPSTAEPFLLSNPGKVKRVEGPSIRMMGGGLNVAVGEQRLKNLLDTTIRAMLESGTVEKIMSKYTTMQGQFFLPAKPWGEAVPVGAEQK